MPVTADLSMSSAIDDASPAFPAAPPRPHGGVLVGRDADLARLSVALSSPDARIVTLAGPGGSGKSRLAAEAAARSLPEFGGRVAWIDLASIQAVDQVESEVVSGIGLGDVAADRLPDELAATLGGAPTLLILDDAEHVIDGVRAVADVLVSIPAVRLLVTTTTPLARPDEVVVTVDPLELPADDRTVGLAENPAIRLLLDRAQAAGAEIALTPSNAAALARIVRRVDGLPLAIELAGAMLRLLAPHQLLDRLDAHFELEAPDPSLIPGAPPASADVTTGPDRRRSLRATMDWSHDLLAPEVQCLYRRLGVFSGTFGLGQLRSYVDRSVDHGLSAPEIDPAEGIAALVAASLVRVVDAPDGDEPRYELLGLVRDDAARRLAESGEATAANWAHANDLQSLAEARYAELSRQARPDTFADLDTAHDDFLAVLDRARSGGNAAFVVRLAGALAEYWRVRGLLTEGRMWLDAALRMQPAVETAFRARALHGAGVLAMLQGDFDRARERLDEAFRLRVRLGLDVEAAGSLNQIGLIALERGELDEAERVCREALDMRRQIGDEAALASSLNSLGGVLQFSGNDAEAREMFEESLEIRRRLGDDAGVSVVLGNLGLAARDAGELDDALRMLEESIETRERLGDRQRLAIVRHNHALVRFDAGDLAGAREELEWSVATARDLGDRKEVANALSDLGFVFAATGDLDGAAARHVEALSIATRIRARSIAAQAIDGIAEVVARRGDPMAAAGPMGCRRNVRQASNAALLLADRRRVDRSIAAAREAADADAWWSSWAAGESLSFEDAVDAAISAVGYKTASEPATAAV